MAAAAGVLYLASTLSFFMTYIMRAELDEGAQAPPAVVFLQALQFQMPTAFLLTVSLAAITWLEPWRTRGLIQSKPELTRSCRGTSRAG